MRISDRAYAQLLAEIEAGDLPAGSTIAEAQQAARLSVSRTPMREAIARLLAEGLLVQRSPRLTVVAELEPQQVQALFETRRALEEMAARLAAERGDAEVFVRFRDAFSAVDLADALGRASYYKLIAEFDFAVDAAVENEFLVAALRTVRTHLGRVRRIANDKPDRLAASVTEHRTIAAAIARRDGVLAAHATHVHLANALTSIQDSLASARADRGASRTSGSISNVHLQEGAA